MNLKKLSLLALLIPACFIHARQAIFIDPANVVFEVNTMSFFKDEIGVFSGTTYVLFGGNPTKLKNKIFKSLYHIGAQNCPTELAVRDPEGDVLPVILCDFLSDKVNTKETRKKAVEHLKKSHKKGQELEIMERITKAVFDPAKLSYHTSIINRGHTMVEELAAKHGSEKLYILANFNKETALHMLGQEHMLPLAKHFPKKNIFVSGILKDLLPNKACFEKVLKSRNLDASQCVFITAMPYHAQTAREMGLTTILVQNKDLKKAHQELKAHGIL